MIAVGLLFVRILCDYFKSRQRLEAEILVQCLKRPLLVCLNSILFSPFAPYCRSHGSCVTANWV
jgi:hypothetical protein